MYDAREKLTKKNKEHDAAAMDNLRAMMGKL